MRAAGRGPADVLKETKVRSADGRMIPLPELMRFGAVAARQRISHYNLRRTVLLSGDIIQGATVEAAQRRCREAVRRVSVPEGYRVLLSGTELEKPENLTPEK